MGIEGINNTDGNKEFDKAAEHEAKFELLKDADMPDGIFRYAIKDKKHQIIGNFFECREGYIDFKLVENANLDNFIKKSGGKNRTALIMPLPFVGNNGTEGFVIANGQKSSEAINYRGDNAIIWFKNGRSGIIKVKVGDNTKTKGSSKKIQAYDPSEQKLLDEILDEKNSYTAAQQISILQNGQKSCEHVGSTNVGKGRKYRFLVQTDKGSMGVIDFKEDITINQAVEIMKKNGVRNAVYADIVSYNIYFGDKKGNFFTRNEKDLTKSNYQKLSSTNIKLPNRNCLIIYGK